MFDKSNGTIYTISTPEGPKEVALPHFPEMPDKIVCPINQSQFKIIRPNNTADIEFLKEYSQLMIRQTRQTYIAIDTECASRPSEGKPWGPRLASIQFAEFTYDPRTLIFSFGLGIIAYWPTDPIISTLITSIFNRPNVNLYFYDLTSDYTFMEDENIRIDKCQIYDSQTRYLNEYETSFFIHKPTKSLLKAVQDTCSYCPLSVNAYYYMEPLKNRNFGLIHYIRSKLRIYYPLTINDSTHIYAAGDVVLTSIAAMALYRDGVDLKVRRNTIKKINEIKMLNASNKYKNEVEYGIAVQIKKWAYKEKFIRRVIELPCPEFRGQTEKELNWVLNFLSQLHKIENYIPIDPILLNGDNIKKILEVRNKARLFLKSDEIFPLLLDWAKREGIITDENINAYYKYKEEKALRKENENTQI